MLLETYQDRQGQKTFSRQFLVAGQTRRTKSLFQSHHLSLPGSSKWVGTPCWRDLLS